MLAEVLINYEDVVPGSLKPEHQEMLLAEQQLRTAAAIEHQQKALIIYQRVLGFDHYETARAHVRASAARL